MTLSPQAKQAVVPNSVMHALAARYIKQATAASIPGNIPHWQRAVHPQIFIASSEVTEPETNLLYFCGGANPDGSGLYKIGVGREQEGGGMLVQIHVEGSSNGIEQLIGFLGIEYNHVMGGLQFSEQPELPNSACNNAVFRHVPGTLEKLAAAAFSTIIENSWPLHYVRMAVNS